MPEDLCSACQEPLLIEVEPDSDAEESKSAAKINSVPDDVLLTCGCHYHWECFLDAYNITQCPSCEKNISSLNSTGQQQVLVVLRNEGGVQTDYDILPAATEEAYLRAYPEERRGHAYLEFCREGDIDAIVHLVQDGREDEEHEQEDDGSQGEIDILSYRGTFEAVDGTGLHVAIRHNQQEVAWLLLALASELEWSKFPPAVLQAMKNLDLQKEDRRPQPDIRTLEDNDGRTPMALAKEVGGIWTQWLAQGWLAPSTP